MNIFLFISVLEKNNEFQVGLEGEVCFFGCVLRFLRRVLDARKMLFSGWPVVRVNFWISRMLRVCASLFRSEVPWKNWDCSAMLLVFAVVSKFSLFSRNLLLRLNFIFLRCKLSRMTSISFSLADGSSSLKFWVSDFFQSSFSMFFCTFDAMLMSNLFSAARISVSVFS